MARRHWMGFVATLVLSSCTSVSGTGTDAAPIPAPAAEEPPAATVPPPVVVEEPDRNGPPPERSEPDVRPPALTDTLVRTASVVGPVGRIGPDGVAELDALESRIGAVLDRPPFDGMFWGILVREARSGRVVYERNAKRKFVPASALKVLTTAAALRALGPDYRYRTEVYRDGPVRGGTLDGSLYISASGDPTWSARFRSGWRQPMEALADRIRAAGIRRVTGRVVVDASRWDSTSVVGTWQVEDVPWGWAASGGGLVAADGALRLRVVGSRTRDRPAAVIIEPELPADRFDGQVMTTATDSVRLFASYDFAAGQIKLRGEVPRQRRYASSLAMRDPVRITTELLMEVFRQKGITVDRGTGFAWDLDADLGGGCGAGRLPGCAHMDLVAALESASLMTIAKVTLEVSQNFLAEQLVRTLALETTGRAEWSDGLHAARDVLVDQLGVNPSDLDLHDGSGLSSYSLVTPRALVTVLEAMSASDMGPDFKDALASPGELDSTLERRLGGLEGRMSAKTGTLHHVNSLAGFLTRGDGEELVFAIMSNSAGMDTDDVRAALDQVVRELARQEAEPTP